MKPWDEPNAPAVSVKLRASYDEAVAIGIAPKRLLAELHGEVRA